MTKKARNLTVFGLMVATVGLIVAFWLLPAGRTSMQKALIVHREVTKGLQFDVEPPPPPKNPPFTDVLKAMTELLKAASPIVTAVLAVKVHRKGKKR